ncbi:MAG: DUF4278 domain-containing protein [Leptolyngbyaceae cyanobacterium]
MSLIYRGQTAQPSTTTKTLETGMNGTFRGHTSPIRQAKQPARRTAPHLQSRGVMY